MDRFDRPARVLLLISTVSVLGLLCAGRIPQDPAYHLFADTRSLAGVVNAWNVFSNLPFLIVGGLGLWRLPRLVDRECRAEYALFCGGVFLVGIGSAVYHHAPSNATLLWDRLPMCLAFMALFALLLKERVLDRSRTPMLWLLPLLGVGGALYWSWSEARGAGDLRPYVLVQFLPILLVPPILALYPKRYLSNRRLAGGLGLYCLAKVLEGADRWIFGALHTVSGHTLKHLVAALAVVVLIQAVPVEARVRTRRSSRVRPLLAGLFALLASGCVSSRPWRACAPPCEGPQIEQAARVAVLRKDRVTSYLKHVHWSADRESLVGSGKSRVGRPAAPVVVPRSEICALFTQRVEPGRVAENAVLVPLAVAGEILFEILAGVIHAEVEHADWPPPKSEIYFPRTCADWARLPAVPVAPPP